MEDANEKEARSIRLQGLCECQREGGERKRECEKKWGRQGDGEKGETDGGRMKDIQFHKHSG